MPIDFENHVKKKVEKNLRVIGEKAEKMFINCKRCGRPTKKATNPDGICGICKQEQE